MENNGSLELLACLCIALVGAVVYVFLMLILLTFKVDDKLEAKGISKTRFKIVTLILTILGVVFCIYLSSTS